MLFGDLISWDCTWIRNSEHSSPNSTSAFPVIYSSWPRQRKRSQNCNNSLSHLWSWRARHRPRYWMQPFLQLCSPPRPCRELPWTRAHICFLHPWLSYGDGETFNYSFITFIRSLSEGSEQSYENLCCCALVGQKLVSVETHLPMSAVFAALSCLLFCLSPFLQHDMISLFQLICWNKHAGKNLELSLASCETHTSMDCHGKRSWPLNFVLHLAWNKSSIYIKIFKNISNIQKFIEGVC